jgi:hypothetical protein
MKKIKELLAVSAKKIILIEPKKFFIASKVV